MPKPKGRPNGVWGDTSNYNGYKMLALGVIKDGLHQWRKNKSMEAKLFLESDMFPYLEIAGIDIDSYKLRSMIRNEGLTPYTESPHVS